MVRLPDDSLVRTTPEIRERLRQAREWTLEHELLAQIKEEVSITASDHRRRRPVEVPRPAHLKRGQTGETGMAHAVSVLKAAHAARRRSQG
ncbi:hypothetical protein ACFY05_32150 [Microtetraspora fusca]|uniref:Uncharacterized protein n=1 Tax=Microtetraspora fusca TaxID=1997 RepID=A0ABW6VID1_MICFU